MSINVWLYDTLGEELGKIQAEDGGSIPREGQDIRITEGENAGDYIVTYSRWRIPASDVQLRLMPKPVDSWPSLDDTDEDFDEHDEHDDEHICDEECKAKGCWHEG